MKTLRRLLPFIACSLLSALITGCAAYVAPGPRAELSKFAPPDIAKEFDKQPSSPFPATVAAVRLQGRAYENYNQRLGSGADQARLFTVIFDREIESPEDLAKIGSLEGVVGITGLNRMLLDSQIDSDVQLRQAAAKVQADLVFVYTFDTAFFEKDYAKPLTAVTLGFSPSRKVTVTTTASALLVDTRTGFIYATFEQTVRDNTLASTWGSAEAADTVRRANEKAAFKKLVDEVQTTWPVILKKYRP